MHGLSWDVRKDERKSRNGMKPNDSAQFTGINYMEMSAKETSEQKRLIFCSQLSGWLRMRCDPTIRQSTKNERVTSPLSCSGRTPPSAPLWQDEIEWYEPAIRIIKGLIIPFTTEQ